MVFCKILHLLAEYSQSRNIS